MTLRPYLIFSRSVIVHVSHIHIPRALITSTFLYPITALSANPFADILDINTTSREPRVTSLALVVVRL